MSRLFYLSPVCKRCRYSRSHGSTSQACLSKRRGLSRISTFGQSKKHEIIDGVIQQQHRNAHVVGLAPRSNPIDEPYKERGTQERISDLGKSPRYDSKDRKDSGPRLERLLSATRLPWDFFRDLEKLPQLRGAQKLQSSSNFTASESISQLSVDHKVVKIVDAPFETFGDIEELEAGIQQVTESTPTAITESAQATFEAIWDRDQPRKKIDLSQVEPLRIENSSLDRLRKRCIPGTAFRADSHTDNRRTTKSFMLHVYGYVSATSLVPDKCLESFIKDSGSSLLDDDPDRYTNLLRWSWILLTDGPTAVKRLLALVESPKADNSPYVPLWIVLQILRHDWIDAQSLHSLVSYISQNCHRWRLSRDNSSILIIVRLLRHARNNAVSAYQPIIDLFLDLLDLRRNDEGVFTDSARITHWCNRILALLAIPPKATPYRSVLIRQASQLSIVNYMHVNDPEIPLSREGFRALAKVQLMHSKTEREKEWADAKAHTWPPFQNQHRMGVSLNEEYLGKQSRVMRVLQRMKEAGYSPHEFEGAVQVLSGWDVDMTPTIQTRTTTNLIRHQKFWAPGNKYSEPNQSPTIWSARIQATRTIREAWMCFNAYQNQAHDAQQDPEVYHAMFIKLTSKSARYSEGGPVPGDGPETFPDPDLQRDLVYIPENVPTPSEFYSRMIDHGVRPHSAFLVDLLDQAPTLDQGFEYIKQARIPEGMKRAMEEPDIYREENATYFRFTMPPRLLRSYIAFLTRPYPRTPERWRQNSDSRQLVRNINGYHHAGITTARNILMKHGIDNTFIWAAYFRSLVQHTTKNGKSLRRLDIGNVWKQMVLVISHLPTRTISHFDIFAAVANVAFKLQTTNVDSHPTNGRLHRPHVSTAKLVKRLFIQAATGLEGRNVELGATARQWHRFCRVSETSKILHSVPTGDNIESMVWILALQDDTNGIAEIMDFLHWLVKTHSQISSAGYWVTKHNVCAFRTILEGSWIDRFAQDNLVEVVSTTPAQLREAEELVKELVWPDDETTQRYLYSRRQAFESLWKKRNEKNEHL